MKNTATQRRFESNQGSAIAAVLIIATTIAIISFNLLRMSETEANLNENYTAVMQARYANFSALETIAAQINDQILGGNLPATGGDFVFSLPASFDTFFDSSLIGSLVDAKTEVYVGSMPTAITKYIDPDNPLYDDDDLLGLNTTSFEIPIYAKTTFVGRFGKEVTAYGKLLLDARSSPLFSYAVFFNMDLPMFAGGDIILNGRVHANGDISVSSNGSNSKQVFFDTVTMTGSFLDDAFFGYNNKGDTMFFTGFDASGNKTFVSNMTKEVSYTEPGSGGKTYTSTALNIDSDLFDSLQTAKNSANHLYSLDDKFYELSLSNFKGYLKTGLSGVAKRSPPAMDDYTPATRSTSSDFVNTAYQIIQPVRNINSSSLTPPDATDADYSEKIKSYQKEVLREKNKYAYRSGLIIDVKGVIIDKVDPKNTSSSTTYKTLDPTSVTFEFYTYERDSLGDIVYDAATGEPKKIAVGVPSDLIELDPYVVDSTDATKLASGMRDNRRERSLNLIKMDVGRLKELIDTPSTATGTTFSIDGDGSNLNSGWWNGGVYVNFPYNPVNPRTGSSGPAADGVQPAIDGYGLYLHNGKSLPSQGLSIATNNPVYLAGHYNADGVISPDSTTTPDAGEVPASIAADAVTLLSENWEANENWKNSVEGAKTNTRPASNTEYAVAILTGQVPKGKKTETGTQSNDTLANFLRLHEDWGSGKKDFYVRGSIAGLFESELANQHLPGHSDIYVYPGRNFGYSSLFETKQPPLSPSTGNTKEIRHRILTKAEFDSEVASL